MTRNTYFLVWKHSCTNIISIFPLQYLWLSLFTQLFSCPIVSRMFHNPKVNMFVQFWIHELSFLNFIYLLYLFIYFQSLSDSHKYCFFKRCPKRPIHNPLSFICHDVSSILFAMSTHRISKIGRIFFPWVFPYEWDVESIHISGTDWHVTFSHSYTTPPYP